MKIPTIKKKRVGSKRNTFGPMIKAETIRSMLKRIREGALEDLSHKNLTGRTMPYLKLNGAIVSPWLSRFGRQNETSETWVPKREMRVEISELFLGIQFKGRDGEMSKYFFLKAPRYGEFFLRLKIGKSLEVVERVPISVVKKAVEHFLPDNVIREVLKDLKRRIW